MNSEDTDVIFVPLSLSFSFINPRHSYPPLRCLSSMPVQHIMRSYSDSHLFLKLAAATTTVRAGDDEDRTSWYSGGELWDMDYVQHWLRLDETRTAIQQRMEYDAAELEDWTMDDGTSPGSGWKRTMSPATDGRQRSLPCIEEDDATSSSSAAVRCTGDDDDDELDSSAKEMSWHHFNHHHNHHNHNHNHNHLTTRCNHQQHLHNQQVQQHRSLLPSSSSPLLLQYGSGSPGGDSWSSADEYAAPDTPPSKRSSAASCCSDSIELLPPPGPIAGTDFTRDFYRLVKFESSKSLASTSSRSVTGGCDYRRRPVAEAQLDREQALQSVLDFIAEQQQYCLSRQAEDKREPATAPSPSSVATAATVDDATTAAPAGGPSSASDGLSPPQKQQTCDTSNSYSDNLLNSKDSGLCGSDVEIECLPEDGFADRATSPQTSAASMPLLRTVPEEDDCEDDDRSSSAKSTSPQLSSSVGVGSSSVCTADTAVMVTWPAATSSKDLIDQLNRMAGGDIGSGVANEISPQQRRSPLSDVATFQTDLDEACCCPTGWVHVERDIDFADPKVGRTYYLLKHRIRRVCPSSGFIFHF